MSKDLNVSAVKVRDDEDGIRWVTFDRPEASNAVTLADLDHIVELVSSPSNQPRAMVFTGTGTRCFSAGMHLKAITTLDTTLAREFITKNRNVLGAIRKAPFPTISAVNGHCLGFGFGVALVSDIRIVADHATFGLTEIKVGVPCVCDIALLQQFVGLGKAKEMILTGDNYPATELPGLTNVLVPGDRLMAETQNMVARVACHTKTVVAAQKRLFEAWQNTGHAAGVEMSIEVFANVFGSEETALQARKHKEATGRRGK